MLEPPSLPPKRHPMVCWFDPGQLVMTAVDVIISTVFGRHSDKRLIEAMTLRDDEPRAFHYPKNGQPAPEEFWLDYTADVGDGWNSTLAVAHWLTRENLPLVGPDGSRHFTRRGSVLLFGGDQVYPTASRRNYEERLLAPWRAAVKKRSPLPDLFAIPGNHDWYDSLVSFSRVFMAGKDFGAWQTRQRRSYFALRLPHGWWLFGIDVQLGSDIDVLQQDYFRHIAGQMGPADRVIICTAEPEWVYEEMYSRYDEHIYSERILRDFEDRILGRRADLVIAGDLHHYRRHERSSASGDDRRQKITAGGGGAFLHPTHGPKVDKIGRSRATYRLQCAYPDARTSRRLTWRNLLFPLWNPRFLLLSGPLYLLTAWAMQVDLMHLKSAPWTLPAWWEAVVSIGLQLLLSPPSAFWVLALLGGFIFFTDTHSPKYRFLGGMAHCFAHLTAIFVIAWAAIFTARGWGIPADLSASGIIGWYLLPALWIFAAGAITGAFIFGAYLLISLNVFGRHGDEAFSSLGIQDWKNFLRLRITADGLTIFPVGIDRVPRQWRESEGECHPADPRATEPRLIEPPIQL